MNRLPFYLQHYWKLAPILLDLMRHGIHVDGPGLATRHTTYRDRCETIQDRIAYLVGVHTCTCGHPWRGHVEVQPPIQHTKAGAPKKRQPPPTHPCDHDCPCTNFVPVHQPLHANKDLSSDRVIKYLYTHMGLPKQRVKGEETLTANEVALRKLLLKVNATEPMVRPTPKTPRWRTALPTIREVLTLMLEHREKAKLATYCEPTKVDPDGRLRCMYKVTTETGRLASAKNPMGTGYNLQNIPRGALRECFLPDPGCLLLELDYSQSESRLVKVLSKDPEAAHQARLLPADWDDHSEGARRMFSKVLGIPPADVDVKVEVVPGTTRRQLAKPIRHGVNYGEGAARIQETLLKDGVVLTLELCQQLLLAAQEPYVLAYQMETRKRVMRHFAITNSWGRTLDFHGCRLNDETYRRAYAFRGASENADALNQLGLIPLHTYIRRHTLRSRINLQVHDSLVVSVFPDEAWSILCALTTSMEQERIYEGVPLAIPTEAKLGTTWACEVKYPTFPTRAAFERDVQTLMEKAYGLSRSRL